MTSLGPAAQAAFHIDTTLVPSAQTDAAFDMGLFKRTLQEKFLDWVQMPPEERLRDKYLKDHGLTEDSLAALPPEERAAHEDKIAEQIKKLFLRPDAEELPDNKLLSNAPLSLATFLEIASSDPAASGNDPEAAA